MGIRTFFRNFKNFIVSLVKLPIALVQTQKLAREMENASPEELERIMMRMMSLGRGMEGSTIFPSEGAMNINSMEDFFSELETMHRMEMQSKKKRQKKSPKNAD